MQKHKMGSRKETEELINEKSAISQEDMIQEPHQQIKREHG